MASFQHKPAPTSGKTRSDRHHNPPRSANTHIPDQQTVIDRQWVQENWNKLPAPRKEAEQHAYQRRIAREIADAAGQLEVASQQIRLGDLHDGKLLAGLEQPLLTIQSLSESARQGPFFKSLKTIAIQVLDPYVSVANEIFPHILNAFYTGGMSAVADIIILNEHCVQGDYLSTLAKNSAKQSGRKQIKKVLSAVEMLTCKQDERNLNDNARNNKIESRYRNQAVRDIDTAKNGTNYQQRAWVENAKSHLKGQDMLTTLTKSLKNDHKSTHRQIKHIGEKTISAVVGGTDQIMGAIGFNDVTQNYVSDLEHTVASQAREIETLRHELKLAGLDRTNKAKKLMAKLMTNNPFKGKSIGAFPRGPRQRPLPGQSPGY